ncbi:hypothetical protein ACPA9J_03875 [Pseudomonas aeruginosa]
MIDRIAAEVEQVAKGIPGVTSPIPREFDGGRYVDVQIDRVAGRHGSNIARCPGGHRRRGGGENRP